MRKGIIKCAIFYSICLLHCVESTAAASPASVRAPSLTCELRLGSWCVAEGAFQITRVLANDSVNDRIWKLSGRFRSNSVLVVKEPNGCKVGNSDVLTLMSFDQEIEWDKVSWSRARFRLKADGTCDLEVLFPKASGNPMEWAFSMGLALVRSCRDDRCEGPALSELKSQFALQYLKRKE